jgi:hypothetical protein
MTAAFQGELRLIMEVEDVSERRHEGHEDTNFQCLRLEVVLVFPAWEKNGVTRDGCRRQWPYL